MADPPVPEEALVGRRVSAVRLDQVPDGFAVLSFDDVNSLEIRTFA